MEELVKADLGPLTQSDRVLLLIPTRNGETWAWCLLGNEVDETTDFKGHLAQANLRKTFCDHWLPPRPSEPPSLIDARSEWARLP